MQAWGKVQDQIALFFFDNGCRANFISLGLAAKSGISVDEMGLECEAGMAGCEGDLNHWEIAHTCPDVCGHRLLVHSFHNPIGILPNSHPHHISELVRK